MRTVVKDSLGNDTDTFLDSDGNYNDNNLRIGENFTVVRGSPVICSLIIQLIHLICGLPANIPPFMLMLTRTKLEAPDWKPLYVISFVTPLASFREIFVSTKIVQPRSWQGNCRKLQSYVKIRVMQVATRCMSICAGERWCMAPCYSHLAGSPRRQGLHGLH